MDYTQAITCAILSNEIYGNLTTLTFSQFPEKSPHVFEETKTDTQGAILSATASLTYVVFRGSGEDADWDTNFALNQTQGYPYDDNPRTDIQIHEGFSNAYLSVRDSIHKEISNLEQQTRIIVTGHSLGGALATLCALDLQFNFFSSASEQISLYTFGSPRVGNANFKKSFDRRVPNSYRIINGMDIVPAVPRPWQRYRHVAQEYRVGKRFSWRFVSQRFKDHEIARYLESLRKQ
ncbi:MAG: lipase family protein [Cyanobacteria bacterium P01_F01_bin.150]